MWLMIFLFANFLSKNRRIFLLINVDYMQMFLLINIVCIQTLICVFFIVALNQLIDESNENTASYFYLRLHVFLKSACKKCTLRNSILPIFLSQMHYLHFFFYLRTFWDAWSFMQKDKREGNPFDQRVFLVSIEEHGARGGRHTYTHMCTQHI